jgi:flagellar motility protein MotE (MotC chaperone)
MPISNEDILKEWYPEGTMTIVSKVDKIDCTTTIKIDEVPINMIQEDYEDKIRRRLADKYRRYCKLETKNPDQYKKYIDATKKEGTFILSELYEKQTRAKKSNVEKLDDIFSTMSKEQRAEYIKKYSFVLSESV